jgi:hypothetical protein
MEMKLVDSKRLKQWSAQDKCANKSIYILWMILPITNSIISVTQIYAAN